ncbi:hypothetical protein H4219_004370 [Mycoemilia scoparia]|uniref:Uncharacterized protein n=1 Tax=Mycoemilia scoparia TaxID=417184 RepID=A0A9W7ZXQ3_9FUNG|nr:hypothetical protein H4219_004370 [Mycoemilia scoparia]
MSFPIFPGSSIGSRQTLTATPKPHRFAYDFSMVDPGMFTPLPEKKRPQRLPRRHIAYTIPLDSGDSSDDNNENYDVDIDDRYDDNNIYQYTSLNGSRSLSTTNTIAAFNSNKRRHSRLKNERRKSSSSSSSSTTQASKSSHFKRDGHILGVNSIQICDNALDGSSNGKTLYTAGRDGTIKVWELTTGGDSTCHNGNNKESHAPGDKNNDGNAQHDLNDGDQQSNFPFPRLKYSSFHHFDWVNDIVAVNNGLSVISGSSDRTVSIWTPEKISEDDKNVSILGYHDDYVKALANCEQQGAVASGGLDQKIKLWDIRESRSSPIVSFGNSGSSGTSSIYSLASTGDGTMLASASPERIVRLWDTRAGRQTTSLAGHIDHVRNVLISQDGEWVLSGSSDASIKLWSVRARRCLTTYTHHETSIWSLFSPHPQLKKFYSASKDGILAKVVSVGSIDGNIGGDMLNMATSRSDGAMISGSNHGHLGGSFDVHSTFGHHLLKSARPTSITSRQTIHHEAEGPVICMAIGRHENGITRIAACPDDSFIWTATKPSAFHCWRDVEINQDTVNKMLVAQKVQRQINNKSTRVPIDPAQKSTSLTPSSAAQPINGTSSCTNNALLSSLMSPCILVSYSQPTAVRMQTPSKTFHSGYLPPHLLDRHGNVHRRTQSYAPVQSLRQRRYSSSSNVNTNAVSRNGPVGYNMNNSEMDSIATTVLSKNSPQPYQMGQRARSASQGPRDDTVSGSSGNDGHSQKGIQLQSQVKESGMNGPVGAKAEHFSRAGSHSSSIGGSKKAPKIKGSLTRMASKSRTNSVSTTSVNGSEGGAEAPESSNPTPTAKVVKSDNGESADQEIYLKSEPKLHNAPKLPVITEDTSDILGSDGTNKNKDRTHQPSPSFISHLNTQRAPQKNIVTNETVIEQSEDVVPIRSKPQWSMFGRPGIIRHRLLNNKRHVLTQDSKNRISLWDILTCRRIKTFSKSDYGTDLNTIECKVNTQESVPAWCSVDTKIGRLTVHMDQLSAWDAEVHVDELLIFGNETIKAMGDHERINIGQWMLKMLFRPYALARHSQGTLSSEQMDALIKLVRSSEDADNAESVKTSSGSRKQSVNSRTSQSLESRNEYSDDQKPLGHKLGEINLEKQQSQQHQRDTSDTSSFAPKDIKKSVTAQSLSSALNLHSTRPLSSIAEDSGRSVPSLSKAVANAENRSNTFQSSTLRSYKSQTLPKMNAAPPTLNSPRKSVNLLDKTNPDITEQSHKQGGSKLSHSRSIMWLSKFKLFKGRRSKKTQKAKATDENQPKTNDPVNRVTLPAQSYKVVDTEQKLVPNTMSSTPALNLKTPMSSTPSSLINNNGLTKQESIGKTPSEGQLHSEERNLPASPPKPPSQAEKVAPLSPSKSSIIPIPQRRLTNADRVLVLLRQQFPDKNVLYNPEFYPYHQLPPNISVYILEESFDASCPKTIYAHHRDAIASRPPPLSLYHEVKDPITSLELCAPSWVIDFLLHNRLPSTYTEPPKISFMLSPYTGTTLPALPNNNARLVANSMLRARKLAVYVVDKLAVMCPPSHYVKSVEHTFFWYLKKNPNSLKEFKKFQSRASHTLRGLSYSQDSVVNKSKMEQFFEFQGEKLTDEEREGLRAYECWKLWTMWKDSIKQPISPPTSPLDHQSQRNQAIIGKELNNGVNGHTVENGTVADEDKHMPPTPVTSAIDNSSGQNKQQPQSPIDPVILEQFLNSRPKSSNISSNHNGYVSATSAGRRSSLDLVPPKIYRPQSEIWVELRCKDKVLTPLTTLATTKAHIWKFSTDVQIMYRWQPFVTNRAMLASQMKL